MKAPANSRDDLRFLVTLAALFNIAVAQPIYDLMSKNVEFFVAHRATPTLLVVGCLLLSVGVPVCLYLLYLAVSSFGASARTASRAVLVATICTVGFLPVVNRYLDLPSWTAVGIAFAASVLVAFGYVRSASWQRFFTYLSPGIVVFPALFLVASPVSRLLWSPSGDSPIGSGARSDAPVFVIVFDEMSTVSLQNTEGMIDEVLFPNFARLANGAHWFRNATTVSHGTARSVPAVLSGQFPNTEDLPLVADHPVNLLTLMAPSHEIQTFETITDLCPPGVCSQERPSAWATAGAVTQDLLVVYGHIVVPSDHRGKLPSLAGRWTGFRDPVGDLETDSASVPTPDSSGEKSGRDAWEAVKARVRQGVNRRAIFDDFVASIDGRPIPKLSFIHILLPHVPYQFLPDGRYYTELNELPGWLRDTSNTWVDDELLVDQGYQRYLLQVGFVDFLLGQFLDRLQAAGIYDDALVVVTADHGVNFIPGETRRGISEQTSATILPIPLLIKEPNQTEGQVHDSNVEIIDVLPTMAQILGLDLPEDMPGSSALDPRWRDRPVKRALYYDVMEFSPNMLDGMERSVDHKYSLFGKRGDTLDLYDHGPLPELLGRSAEELEVSDRVAGGVEIDDLHQYGMVASEDRFVPARIRGTVDLEVDRPGRPLLAVSANGRIVAVTGAYQAEANLRFAAMIPPAALNDGANRLDIFLVDQHGDGAKLLPLSSKSIWQLLPESIPEDGERLYLPDGRIVGLAPRAPRGGARMRWQDASHAIVGGWVADVDHERPAWAVLAYLGDRLVGSVTSFQPRAGVADLLGEDYLNTGFTIRLPRSEEGAEMDSVRVFALLENGTGAEIPVKVESALP